MQKYYIDHIRSYTILLVVVYHVIYMFNSVTIRTDTQKPVDDFAYLHYDKVTYYEKAATRQLFISTLVSAY